MHEAVIEYQVDGKTFKGLLVSDEGKTPRAGILVAHAYKGQDAFAKQKARELAKLGYIAFAADIYGDGQSVATAEEATALMQPLFVNRAALRERIGAAFDTFKQQPQVDPEKIGAIGFCFGGLTVIELLRSGKGLKGCVSFHGILGERLGGKTAKLEPNRYIPRTAILVLNGYEDPMVPESDVSAIQKEFNDAGLDWEMNTYGHTKHAFTVPEANEGALKYNPTVCKRAWRAMEHFFAEILRK